jgi:HemY protein
MKTLFWMVALFAAAVALALLMGQNDAIVTLFWFPYRVDVSFNLVLTGLLLAFVLLHLALRSWAGLRGLPSQARRWRQLQRERHAYAALLDALSHQLAGRFVRARASAEQVLDQVAALHDAAEPLPRAAQMQVLAHLLAAEAAQSLQEKELRHQHLTQALQSQRGAEVQAAQEGALLRAIHWALEDRHLEAAGHWMSLLPQGTARRTLALRLKLKLARLSQDTRMALETARLLAKHRAFSPDAARTLLRNLFQTALNQAHDPSQVRQVWKGLESNERNKPEVLLAVASRLHALGEFAAEDSDDSSLPPPLEQVQHAQLLREWLLPVWDAWVELSPAQKMELVGVMQDSMKGLDANWLKRIEDTQRQYPHEPLLQYLAAEAFFQRELWGKATQLFQQVSHTSLGDTRLHVRTWCRLAELAELRHDTETALHAWRQAALQGSIY